MVQEWTKRDVAAVLQVPTAADDKYSRGVLGMHTGSAAYPGAAVLGVQGAWRTGVGLVRYTGVAGSVVLAQRPETVAVAGRVQAWVIGSGMDASGIVGVEAEALTDILDRDQPVVVDAGALELAVGARCPLIVTPHAREHARLRAALGLPDLPDDAVRDGAVPDDAVPDEAVRETARVLGGLVVAKGARTVIADPGGWCVSVQSGTPWLATAGTGDVLAGVIGAVVAGAVARDGAASLGGPVAAGVWLHGRAATLAATRYGSAGAPITAMDVAEHLPQAVAEVLAEQSLSGGGAGRIG